MNRFATFAVLALAAFALSTNAASVDESLNDEERTQWSLQVSDADETAALPAGFEVYQEFCKSSRDYILSDIKSKTGQMSSKGFTSFFQMAEEVTQHAMNANQDATSRLGAQLRNPDTGVETPDDIGAAQRQISGQSQPMALVTAFKATFGATMSAVNAVVSQKLDAAKNALNIRNWIALAESGCAQADEYEKELEAQFASFQDEVVKSVSNGEKLSLLPMSAVQCVTSSRIIRANGICGFVKVSIEPAKKVFAPYFNQQSVKDAIAE